MANVTDEAPERPADVPTSAVFNHERQEWWQGHRNAAGRYEGAVAGYDRTGVRRWLQHFQDGQLHGTFVRFHPSGAVARTGEFVAGMLHGEVRAVASREPSAEPLRACCVPPGAWSLVVRYDNGRHVDEWFENEAGAPLLSDGSLRPPRPSSVPAAAAFDENERAWHQGTYDERSARQGHWRSWTEAGVFKEEAEYVGGKRSGLWRRYTDGGEVLSERTFVDEVMTGPARQREVLGTYADQRVFSWEGAFDAGRPVGRWIFRDAAGQELYERDFGVVCSNLSWEHPIFGPPRSHEAWQALAERLAEENEVASSLCALGRAVGSGLSLEALRRVVEAKTAPLTLEASGRRVEGLRSVRNSSRTRGEASVEEELTLWVQALTMGVAPAAVFANLALLLLPRPGAGLEFIDVALALDPGNDRFLLTRALLAFELGRLEQAERDIAHLLESAPEFAHLIGNYRRFLFPRFDFWPKNTTFRDPPHPDLPDRVNQPLAEIRRAVSKCVLRLRMVRERLVEISGQADASWLPPTLGELYVDPGVQLDTYTFTEAAEKEDGTATVTDSISVDEVLLLQNRGLTSLMRQARLDWTCLCWLCWGSGLSSIDLPERIEPPPDFVNALTSACIRVFRTSDSLATLGLRSRAQGLARVEWEGIDVDHLDGIFAHMARDEAHEMRAALFFLGDAGCRSVWQDDLRDSE